MLREFVPNQGQAWELALSAVGRYFEEMAGEAHRLDQIDTDLASPFELSSTPRFPRTSPTSWAPPS